MPQTRRLLARLREMMSAGVTAAGGEAGVAALADLAQVVAGEMVAEVCTVYAMRPGDLLELAATHGLNQNAVGRILER